MDNFLQLENRKTGEILRMRRVRDSQGQTVLTIDGSLPPRASGPPMHVHFHEREEGIVKAGTLGAQVGTEKIIVPAGGLQSYPLACIRQFGVKSCMSMTVVSVRSAHSRFHFASRLRIACNSCRRFAFVLG